MKESSLWEWLRDNTKSMERLHMTRIENSASSGIPDVDGCWRSHQFWWELKVCDRPARPTTLIKPRFEPGQVPWLEARCAAGGAAFVLLQVGSRHKAQRYLIPGIHARTMALGLPEGLMPAICVLRYYNIKLPNAFDLRKAETFVIGSCFKPTDGRP